MSTIYRTQRRCQGLLTFGCRCRSVGPNTHATRSAGALSVSEATDRAFTLLAPVNGHPCSGRPTAEVAAGKRFGATKRRRRQLNCSATRSPSQTPLATTRLPGGIVLREWVATDPLARTPPLTEGSAWGLREMIAWSADVGKNAALGLPANRQSGRDG
jgi:hypothetical protein